MRRALLVVLVSLVAIALIALKSSAQSTSPRVSAEEENKVLKQLLGEANAKSDRLGDQLSQMQQANQRLEQEIEKKDKEIAQLRLRHVGGAAAHPVDPGLRAARPEQHRPDRAGVDPAAVQRTGVLSRPDRRRQLQADAGCGAAIRGRAVRAGDGGSP